VEEMTAATDITSMHLNQWKKSQMQQTATILQLQKAASSEKKFKIPTI